MKWSSMAVAAMLSLCTVAHADPAPSNQALNVQGVLRTIAGDLQSAGVGLVVSLYKSQADKDPFYSQTFTTVQVENGFFSVELAGANLSFDASDAWVGIQVAGDPAEMPRQHLTAVPYSFNAARANSCSVADLANGLAPTLVVDAARVKGDGSGITNLSGAALQAGSVPREAVGSWATHGHGLTVYDTDVEGYQWVPLNWSSGAPNTLVTSCSNPCGTHGVMTGGNCWIDGTGCDGQTGMSLRNARVTGGKYCCSAMASSAGACNLHSTGLCVSVNSAL
jgi:hypothetical protein